MAIEGILDREGYNEPTIVLPGRAYEMAQCILSLGGAGNIAPAVVPALLVHLFAVVEPNAEDRDHHRGALFFLAHQGGFTSMKAVELRGGEEMEAGPAPEVPDWVFDERFTNVIHAMHEALGADVGVGPQPDGGFAVGVFCTNAQYRDEDLAERAIRFQPEIRAAIAAITGSDPGYVAVLLKRQRDPLTSMGIDAATQVPEASPVGKVIVDTRDLRSGDIIRLWQTPPGAKNPIRPLPAEEFKVRWLRIISSGGYEETLDLMCLGINRANPDGNGQGYQIDGQGYRWEVIERPVPADVAQAASQHHPV